MEKAFWAVGKLFAKTGELGTVQTVKVLDVYSPSTGPLDLEQKDFFYIDLLVPLLFLTVSQQ